MIALYLRRYNGDGTCPNSGMGYHNAEIRIPETETLGPDGIVHHFEEGDQQLREKYKDSWPTVCACGYHFTETDAKQIFKERLYTDDQGREWTENSAPTGAMWDCDYYHDIKDRVGEDGRSMTVKLPDGTPWCIDSRASNCDMPCLHCGVPYKDHKNFEPGDNHYYEDLRKHKCWVRHGEPPNLHVDKNGNTCGAGAGSIATKGYHGFLQNGQLT